MMGMMGKHLRFCERELKIVETGTCHHACHVEYFAESYGSCHGKGENTEGEVSPAFEASLASPCEVDIFRSLCQPT